MEVFGGNFRLSGSFRKTDLLSCTLKVMVLNWFLVSENSGHLPHFKGWQPAESLLEVQMQMPIASFYTGLVLFFPR